MTATHRRKGRVVRRGLPFSPSRNCERRTDSDAMDLHPSISDQLHLAVKETEK